MHEGKRNERSMMSNHDLYCTLSSAAEHSAYDAVAMGSNPIECTAPCHTPHDSDRVHFGRFSTYIFVGIRSTSRCACDLLSRPLQSVPLAMPVGAFVPIVLILATCLFIIRPSVQVRALLHLYPVVTLDQIDHFHLTALECV